MIEVSALLFTLLAEGTGLLSLILIIWIVLTIRKKSKDKAAATQLVKHIKEQANERFESIKTFLSHSSGLEAEELLIETKKIDRLEKDFFTQLVRLYLKRDADILAKMDEQLDKVITAYKATVAEGGGTSKQGDEEILHKVETLEKEKHTLSEELRITKSTMGNMMTEFNTMFNGGNETVQTSKEALQSTVAEVKEQEIVDDDIALEESIPDVMDESPEAKVTESEVSETVDAEVSNDDIDDIFSQGTDVEASPPMPMSESDDDFGSIVTTDDVDDLLDGIDLSKEIDDQ